MKKLTKQSGARITLIAPAPAPYRALFYDELVRRLPEYEFLALFQGEDHSGGWAADRPTLMDSQILRQTPMGLLERIPIIQRYNPKISSLLDRVSPDVVVTHAFGTPTGRAIANWAWRNRVPFFLRCDSNFIHQMEKPLWRRTLRGLSYQREMRRAFGALSLGTVNEAFYTYRGLGPERQFRVPFLIDASRVARLAAEERATGQMRRKLGIRSPRAILFVGRLIPVKGVIQLLGAYLRIAERFPDVDLVLVGTGPLDAELRAGAGELLGVRVHMPGFFEPDDVSRSLGLADVFAAPSLVEPWGIVLNEAMAAGVPVVTTPVFGAAANLLVDGVNGALVPTGDVSALATCLNSLLSHPSKLEEMAVAAEATYARWTSLYDPVAGFRQALKAALALPTPDAA